MRLNKTSYVHVTIRKLCQLLAYLTSMELTTDLTEEYNEIRFVGKLSYLTIDWSNKVCYAMSHRITKEEQAIIEEIMLYNNWLETGRKYQMQLHK